MRLLIHVEGQTEETFVDEVLAPYLYQAGFAVVSARLLGNARQRSRRGGIKSWPVVRDEVAKYLKTDSGAYSTLMVDYYALPASGPGAWPGRTPGQLNMSSNQKAEQLEAALLQDFYDCHGHEIAAARFIPFVMMHEFEGLLFSECASFAKAIGLPSVASELQEIRETFQSPEDINDSPETAPSKRLLELIPGYQKPLHGNIGALGVGLDLMVSECPHFGNWVQRLLSIIN